MTSMTLPLFSVLFGLALLVWSADRFIDGSAAAARHLGMPPLLIGMIVVGFGTSAPEMAVSALAASQGNPGIGLGNAYGSNIANIALVLGLTALIRPISVHSQILRKELPILTGVTALAAYQVWDGQLSHWDAALLLLVFAGLMAWTLWEGLRRPGDALTEEVEQELRAHEMPLARALSWLLLGLVLLIASSRVLVWGAVEIAQGLGVDDLVIGLTVVAVGTSLPELASALTAARKGEHDIALGNVIGSNLFNPLAVVGIAAAIQPMAVPPEVLSRDMLVMGGLTLSLFAIGFGFRGPGRVNRIEGALLLTVFLGYTAILVSSVLGR
jgi:cation:H+ antiporter